jgi:hypothetical protein
MAGRPISQKAQAAWQAGHEKGRRTQSAAADARARTYAQAFSAIVSEGFVHEGDIARQLNARGMLMANGQAWSRSTVRVVLERLMSLGVVTLPSTGPYGRRRYRRLVCS